MIIPRKEACFRMKSNEECSSCEALFYFLKVVK